ncbi:MAG: aminotransferase class V-fold PLP-dependent enzyme [Gammaproteobacteria bacterium]|nr:aminotransferase class V-fold PLP-dependent enzyme [Gammaproteobacteria bacterium]
MSERPTILLNPGPVTLTERVRHALLREDMCHREADFAALMLDIKSRLAGIYPEAENSFEAVTVTGSGTCAVEAMIDSFASRDRTTLVLSNGVYGERIAAMLESHGRPFRELRADWSDSIDLDRVRDVLAGDAGIHQVVVVHNETTTGRLNDLAPLLDLCAEFESPLMLDAVSSFGAEWIDFSHPSLMAVASTGNKCLHGIVGIAFVMARKALFKKGASNADSLYLDLFRYQAAQVDGFSPFTPAVHACFALQEALAELLDQGGWRARQQHYRQLSEQVRNKLAGLGAPAYLDTDHFSSMISSFKLPKGRDYKSMHDALRSSGFVIYAGQGELYREMFRICTMGDIQEEDMARLLTALEELLCDHSRQ